MYIHTQNVGASTWYVYHNMNQTPIVEVLIHNSGRLTKVKPNKVIHANDNITVIEFSTAQTGVANILGPISGTNSDVEQQPEGPPPAVLRGFNPSDRSGNLNLSDENTTVGGSSGSVRSLVARANAGKYQYRMYYSGNDTSSLFPNGLEIGVATAAFALNNESLYESLNGDKVTFSGISSGSYELTGEFANSTLPGRFIPTNMYPDMLRQSDSIDVLLNLDDNEIDIRVNGSTPYQISQLLPPDKSWHVFFGAYGASVSDMSFDFVGDTFTPDDGFVAWDTDDQLEATLEPFIQSRVPYVGNNLAGLIELSDMRPVMRVEGNGALKSIYGRSGSGKYQFRVFCEREFLNSTIVNGQYIGIASATATENSEPFSALEGDSVVIGYDAGDPAVATVMYSYADQTLPNRGEKIDQHTTRMERDQILDVLLDLDLDRVRFIIRNDDRDNFEVDGSVVYQHEQPIPSGITWHVYLNMVNRMSNITIDTAGYRFTPEPDYAVWDAMDNNLGTPSQEIQPLVPLQGMQRYGSARVSDNGKRSVVSRNDTVRSIQSHSGSGKYQFRIYNERGFDSRQAHLQWHGLGTENATTSENPYNVNQGDLISFARRNVSEEYRIVYKYAESQGMTSDSVFPEAPRYTFGQILDVLLDLDTNNVTFRTTTIGDTNVEGNLVYSQNVSVPANQTWFIHSYFANSLSDTVYDTAGYRFTPDPGYEPWDTVPPPSVNLQGFDPDNTDRLTLLDPYTLRGFGGTRSLLSRKLSNGGKYQVRAYLTRTAGSVIPPNTFFGIANENVVVNDRPFDPNLGDAACFCANGNSVFRVQVEYNDLLGPGQGQTSSTRYPGLLTSDVTIDMKIDIDNRNITWTVLNGASSYTDSAPFFSDNWYVYFRSSNSIPGDLRFDLTGDSFTPDPGFLPWES